jgi:4-carboxymuconolactone decarboxylase
MMMFCLEKFGQERNSFPPRGRSLITISSLMARGILDSSLLYHIKRAKMNGVTAETLTQLAFFAGWSKAWAALRMAKEVYEQE